MSSFEASTNANIQATTRALWKKTVVSQVLMKMPLLARLLLAKKVTWPGGKYITGPVDKDEMDDLGQAYFPNEPMTVGKKSLLESPYFHWKYFQVPVTYDISERIENSGGNQTAPINLIPFLMKKAQRAARIKLYKMMYGIGTAGSDADHDRDFQSVFDALTHDATYGHLTRATTVTNEWWQGASVADTFADQSTDYGFSVNTFRRALAACQKYDPDKPSEYLCVVGPTGYLSLKTQCEANRISMDKGPLHKYGFSSFTIDDVEVVMDPYLRNSTLTNAHLYMFIYHVPSWELGLHPLRSFAFTGFTWQGDRAGGLDAWMARIMCAGNFYTWRPNASIALLALTT